MEPLNARFHSTPERFKEYIVNSLDKAIADGVIVQDDRDLICKFVSHVESNAEHLSPGRQFKLVNVLALSRKFLKVPFREATLQDLEDAVASIKSAKKYKRNTKIDYVRFLRRFCLWLINEGHNVNLTEKTVMVSDPQNPNKKISEIQHDLHYGEKKIQAIKVPRLDNVTKTAEGMLTEQEVKAIIEHCKNSRDRLIVMLAAEGGFRIAELGSLTWGQIKEEPWGLLVNAHSKTEAPRLVPCIHSQSYLAAYKNDYGIPAQPKRGDFVFWVLKRPAKGKTPERVGMQYQAVRKMLQAAVEAAGIQKAVSPHTLRHSAVTQAVRDGMSEQVIKSIFWGNAGTDMLRTYSHLGNKDIVDAVRARYGLVKEPEKKREMKTFGKVQCICGYAENPPTQRFCGQCGAGLTPEAQVQQTTSMDKIVELLKSLSAEKKAEITRNL